MPHPDLRVDQSGHVLTVELDRGPDNYIDVGLATAIADAIESAESDITCRAILLTSSGKHFCAGARLSAAADDLPREGDGNPLYDQVARMFDGTVPIVAAVQGAAVGAGLGLALVADFRVAAPEARFGATFARLGFHPGFGISATLPRVVGEQRAIDMLYSGRRVPGHEALAIGLADRLVSLDDVRAEAVRVADEIAASAPLAVRAATDREHAEQQVLRRTADYREGVTATAERRIPIFQGE